MAERSLLFVPGSRPERFGKALAAGADIVCIDLEDSVAPEGKAAARAAAIDFIAAQGAPAGLWLRINPVRSATGLADILAVLDKAAAPTTLMLPKLSDPADLALLDEVMGDRPIRFVPLIETAVGLRNAAAIATSKRVHALLFGAVDLSVELGCTLDWEPLLHARASLVAAAAEGGVGLFDVPHIDVSDAEGLQSGTARAKALGFTARACIHPAQVAVVNSVFTPTEAEIARANRIVEAFNAAGGGVALLDGKLIEIPVVRAARRVLAAAAG
ncbi:HpcH/HpaI aldolase/citrate lyase family protein [Niveispirillum irakense]|uniref:HpcH/HpaI aldolase/citrate lyase family protein n=1 Tax=Niveispirillum irakense TaxID=34011 RepID=UPI0003F731D5|nr:CoA ester lyase [Niveispirillum irakense]